MSCKSILPTNIDEKINALDVVGCEEIAKIQEALGAIEDFHDALQIDERFLDALADSYEANRFKDFEPRARELILYAQKHYPKLGTVAAVKEVLYAFGLDAEVKEWFEYKGKPYYFRVVIYPDNAKLRFTKEMFAKISFLIEMAKNIRSHLDGYIFKTSMTEKINFFGAWILNPKLSQDEVKISTQKISTQIKIQGAAIWRV